MGWEPSAREVERRKVRRRLRTRAVLIATIAMTVAIGVLVHWLPPPQRLAVPPPPQTAGETQPPQSNVPPQPFAIGPQEFAGQSACFEMVGTHAPPSGPVTTKFLSWLLPSDVARARSP